VRLHPPSSIRRARETEKNNSLGGYFSLCDGSSSLIQIVHLDLRMNEL
jgi:hypothetical protein